MKPKGSIKLKSYTNNLNEQANNVIKAFRNQN